MTGFAVQNPVANESGCWYLTTIYECPVCCRGEEHRTRMPAPAPPKEQRYEYEQSYDYCIERDGLL